MQQILPTTQGRSNMLRVAQSVADMLNSNPLPNQPLITAEGVIQSYKFYDDALMLVTPLSPSTSSYDLNPVEGVTASVPTARLMQRSDLFAVTGVGIFFTRATYSSVNQALSAYGNYQRFTFPYVGVFTGSNEQAGLLNIVNGTISLNVQNDQQWQIPVSRMVYADEYINAQVSTIVYGGSDEKQGILNLDSLVILDGNNDNKVTVQLPTGGTLTNIDGNTNTTTRNIIVVQLKGFRIRATAANGAYNGQNLRC